MRDQIFFCTHCGAVKETLNGLCAQCSKFSHEEPREPSAATRQRAFGILQRHPDCLRDDVMLNELIEDIAEQIEAGPKPTA